MASSSSSSRLCDVFLSFRGVDTRRTFVSFLYDELERKNILTFKDSEKLERGDYISSALLQAIDNSRFAIVVVSENYASSKWCLEELAKIMECNQKGKLVAIPVFYNVEPWHVRRHGGKFGEHLKKHEGRDDPEDVKRWKDALTQLANLSGYNLTECKDDSELVKDIVKDISDRLIGATQSDFSHLLGMDVHMKAIYRLLDLESSNEVRLIGIWGMGGIGKTTLAKYVFEKIKPDFQVHRFLENVKETYRDKGSSFLQEKLLSENQGALEKACNFAIPNVIKSRLGNRRVLVVLDDVDGSEQLQDMVGDPCWFGLGSRVIITTRDLRILEGHGVEHVYEVPCLEDNDALQVFCQFAFPRKRLLPNFEWLLKRAVKLAGCLPLALEVFGSFLRNRSEDGWRSALDQLERSPDNDVMKILKISYDGLGEQEKSIFLRIVILLDYMHKQCDVRILVHEDVQYAGWVIEQLVQKSLIQIKRENIIMHDLVRRMARDLACQRLLLKPDEIRAVLANNQVNEMVESICLRIHGREQLDSIIIKNNAFQQVPNLKYVKLSYPSNIASLRHGVNISAPKLKYFQWNCCPQKSIKFTAKNLVYLYLRNSELEKLWDHPPCLPNLKKIDISLSARLKEFPNLSKAPNVEVILADNCTSLTEIPSSISCLNKLTLLDLQSCQQLKRLPAKMNMESLKTVYLQNCTSLEVFPRFSQGITRVRIFGGRRRAISKSIGYLSHLEFLVLSNLKWLKSLPDTIGDLTSLRILHIHSCPMLRRIPKTIQKLKSLEEISVSDCQSITQCLHLPENVKQIEVTRTGVKEFPSWVGDLRYLDDLYIAQNESLQCLPASIYNLKHVRQLYLQGNFRLEGFPAQIRGTTSLQMSPLSNFARLEFLEISRPDKSNGVPFPCPPLPCFPFLKIMRLVNLNMIEIRDDLGELTHLSDLDLTGNDFEKIPVSIKQLTKLHSLCLKNCNKLRSLPELPSDTIRLCIHECTALETSLVFEEHWQCRFYCKDEKNKEGNTHPDSKSSDGLLTHRKKLLGMTEVFERLKSKASLWPRLVQLIKAG